MFSIIHAYQIHFHKSLIKKYINYICVEAHSHDCLLQVDVHDLDNDLYELRIQYLRLNRRKQSVEYWLHKLSQEPKVREKLYCFAEMIKQAKRSEPHDFQDRPILGWSSVLRHVCV